ncbi:MAG TPA: amino acid permease [Kofleriaceae bacterium]|nr:amino acid permease [Kofleriaceae bacterium]
MPSQLFARKPLSLLLEEAEDDNRLRRCLGPVALTALGVGCVIGAGIFVATGKAAHDYAGPALMLSYVVAGLTCIFAALCYAELASMVPVAGSAFTYAYATLGELFAWIIGWDLILEYAVGSATVANGWSSFFQSLLPKLGIHLPHAITAPPVAYDTALGFHSTGAIINLPAVIIVAIITAILVKGIKESAGINSAIVAVKVAAVLFVIMVGAFFFKSENWHPFAPYGWGGVKFFGHPLFGGQQHGMLAGAAIIFFAYIGFDSVSTHAEEARNPKRDVPIGIIASLIICTVLYIAVVAVLTGMQKYDQIDQGAGVSMAFSSVGLQWAEVIVAIAGVAGITSVLLVNMLSGARVFLAMARDGMVPTKFFGAVHPRFRTPHNATILIGAFVAIASAFLPLGVLLEMANIGTLFAFAIVCAAVLILRKTQPTMERPFRAPLVPIVPVAGIVLCLVLMFSLETENWIRLFVWLGIGLVIYFGYSRHHSVIRRQLDRLGATGLPTARTVDKGETKPPQK